MKKLQSKQKFHTIGSIHCKTLNFPFNLHFFPPTESPQILQSRNFIKDFVDRDILEQKNKRWNKSNYYLKETTNKKKLFNVI